MKKLCFMLTALLLAVPALGVVAIDCAQIGDTNEVEVTYNAIADGNMPRGLGLNISVDMGQTINVLSYDDPNFWVHPGNIVIVDGNVTSEGSPVAPGTDPCTVGQLGSGAITIEMGSLYDPCDPCHPTGPPTSGVLLRFKVSGDCNVTIEGNAARGNVVLENTLAASTNLPSTCNVTLMADCFYVGLVDGCGHLVTQADYDRWVGYGKPASWCYPCHCRGDINGDGLINTGDLQGTDGKGGAILDGWVDAWYSKSFPAACDSDINYDGLINTGDLQGTDGKGGATLDGWVDGWYSKCAGL